MTATIDTMVQKADLAGLPDLVADFAQYAALLQSLPEAVYKMDADVLAAVEAHKPAEVEKAETDKTVTDMAHEAADKPKKDDSGGVHSDTKTPKEALRDGTKAHDKDKTKKDEGMEPNPDDAKVPAETDLTAVLAAITAVKTEMGSAIAGLTAKVDGVVQTQTAQQTAIDAVVQKADALSTTMKSTVTAPPTPGDRVTGTTVTKAVDDDPRTGAFDTAFIRKRQAARR
jgi:hypothetical protein